MVSKLDLTKEYKQYYSAKNISTIVEFKSIPYLAIEGKGEPAGQAFTTQWHGGSHNAPELQRGSDLHILLPFTIGSTVQTLTETLFLRNLSKNHAISLIEEVRKK